MQERVGSHVFATLAPRDSVAARSARENRGVVASAGANTQKQVGRDMGARSDRVKRHDLPVLLDTAEVADMLRTSKKAIYAMIERRQLPGVVRIGRRVLLRQEVLLDWLGQKSSPSLER